MCVEGRADNITLKKDPLSGFVQHQGKYLLIVEKSLGYRIIIKQPPNLIQRCVPIGSLILFIIPL